MLAVLYLQSQYRTSAWEIRSSTVLKKKDPSGSPDHLHSKCIRHWLQKLKKIVPVHQLEYQFSELYSSYSRSIGSILDTVPTFLLRLLCKQVHCASSALANYCPKNSVVHKLAHNTNPEYKAKVRMKCSLTFTFCSPHLLYQTPTKRNGRNCQQFLFLYLKYNIWMNN